MFVLSLFIGIKTLLLGYIFTVSIGVLAEYAEVLDDIRTDRSASCLSLCKVQSRKGKKSLQLPLYIQNVYFGFIFDSRERRNALCLT
jgi:hypothetical protein